MITERTYLDWNATAPLLPEARAAIGRALAATRSARRAGRIGPDEELAFALAAAHGRPA